MSDFEFFTDLANCIRIENAFSFCFEAVGSRLRRDFWRQSKLSPRALVYGDSVRSGLGRWRTKRQSSKIAASKDLDIFPRPIRLIPRHPKPGSISGGDVGLITSYVSRVEEIGQEATLVKQANPRRLVRSEKHNRMRLRRERKLSRSILLARRAKAAEIKLAKCDNSPVTWQELAKTRHRLSNRQLKASRALNKEAWAMADSRDDFLHKLSNQVAKSAEINVVEDLFIKGTMANSKLVESFTDSSLGKLLNFIDYKSEREGGSCLKAPRFFPSTKRCNDYGHKINGS